MLVINRETFLVCLIKHKLSEAVKDGNELGDNVLFTQEGITLFKIELKEEYGIECPYRTDDIVETILQYTELFVIYDTPVTSMYGLRWDEIFRELDGQSLLEYLLTCFGVMFYPSEVKRFLGLDVATESFDISKVSSNAIHEIIDQYEKCKTACLSMGNKSNDEIIKELLDSYNETIISMALNYTRECK